jgi:DNA-directed RNA polymerase subunit K/omega
MAQKDNPQHITSAYLSKYERTVVLATRTHQIR